MQRSDSQISLNPNFLLRYVIITIRGINQLSEAQKILDQASMQRNIKFTILWETFHLMKNKIVEIVLDTVHTIQRYL